MSEGLSWCKVRTHMNLMVFLFSLYDTTSISDKLVRRWEGETSLDEWDQRRNMSNIFLTFRWKLLSKVWTQFEAKGQSGLLFSCEL